MLSADGCEEGELLSQPGAGREHWRRSVVDIVDPLNVDAGDAEVRGAELALDHDQRDAFSGHFDGVRVSELVGRKAPAHTRGNRQATESRASGGGRPPGTLTDRTP